MKRGIIFSATMVALLLVVFFVGLHLLLVDFRRGVQELARRKGEMVARETALNLENYLNNEIDAVGFLSSTLFPLYLEGKISSRDLYRGIALQMRGMEGVTGIQFLNREGVVVGGYPPDKALVGLRLSRDFRSRDLFLLFTQCMKNRKREMGFMDTPSLPMSGRFDHKPLLVVMDPVMIGHGPRVQVGGVLMASLDISGMVARTLKDSLTEGWPVAVFDPGGRVVWRRGRYPLSSPGGRRIKVEVPFRVAGGEWKVEGEVPLEDVEAGAGIFYRKIEALILAFLFVLGLSLFSVYLEVKKSYRALALSQERFRTLVEGMKEVFYIREREGEVSYMSPGVEGKLGVSREGLLEALSSLPSREVDGVLEVEGRILEVKEQEREGAFFGLVRDVTRERSLALEVERERRFLDDVLSSLGSGVMVLDGERRVIWMNTHLREMFDLHGVIQGRFCYSLLAGRKSPCPHCYLEGVLRGNRDQGEGIKRHPVPLFGEERDLFMKVQRMAVGGSSRFLVIYQDITETRRMEERVYFMDKLSSLGKLAASVAHELSTPLSVTSINLETVLKKERLSPSARRLLEVSAEELRRSGLLLQRLRWIYRPLSMKRGEVRIDRILKDVGAILRIFARERRVGLNLEITPVAPFLGYREPLMQVLLNLATNALEASPPGEEVTLRAEEEEGMLVITIRDRGGGIPDSIREHLFQPFVTGKGERGAGLGLYLSCKLVEGMGGNIEVESREGEGTVFTVRLPMTPVEGGEESGGEDPPNRR